jgi:hypothetical protein
MNIVDFAIEVVIFYSYVNVYQRVGFVHRNAPKIAMLREHHDQPTFGGFPRIN